jgi:hypothetical protein
MQSIEDVQQRCFNLRDIPERCIKHLGIALYRDRGPLQFKPWQLVVVLVEKSHIMDSYFSQYITEGKYGC